MAEASDRRSKIPLYAILFGTLPGLGSAHAQELPNETLLHDVASPSWQEVPCPVEVPQAVEGVYCGLVDVPETYDRSPRSIRIAVLVAPAVVASGPPVIFLNGGPGYPSIPFAPDMLAASEGFGALRATRDLIFVDQRGTGYSRPVLNCPELEGVAGDTPNGEGSPARLAALKACRTRLVEAGVNLAAYRTDLSSRDLDLVRRALGYDRASIYGTSYGAWLGLQRLRATPAWLESAALFGVSDPLRDTYAENTRKFQQALEALDEACRERPECSSRYGSLRTNVDRVLRDLEAGPKEVTYPDFETGELQTTTLTADDVGEGLYGVMSLSGVLPWLPLMFAEAAEGSYAQLASIGFAALGGEDEGPNPRSEGMRWSALCAENLAFSSRALFRAYAHGTDHVVSEYLLRGELQRFDICNVWDVPRAPLWLHAPVLSQTPTLLISAAFDPRTPTGYAEGVSRFLRRDRIVELASASHAGAEPCETRLLTSFFAAPGGALDDDCASEPIRFVYRVPDGFLLR